MNPAPENPDPKCQREKSLETPATPPKNSAPEKNLTPEEQWELFEKELKETDWGHQPC